MKDTDNSFLVSGSMVMNEHLTWQGTTHRSIKGQTDLLLYIIDQAILLLYEYILFTCCCHLCNHIITLLDKSHFGVLSYDSKLNSIHFFFERRGKS